MPRLVKHLLGVHAIIVAAALLPCEAWGTSDLGLQGLGLAVRFVGPDAADATLGVGGLADLGGFTRRVRLEARVDFWSQSERVFSDGKASARDITVGARSKYEFPLSNPQVRPFAGAGLGIHFLHFEVDVPEQNNGGIIIPASHAEDSLTRLGIDVGGGMNYDLKSGPSILSELWFTIVDGGTDVTLGMAFMWNLGGSGTVGAESR